MKNAYAHAKDKNKLAKDERRSALIESQRTERVDTWTDKMNNDEIIEAKDDGDAMDISSDDEAEPKEQVEANKESKPVKSALKKDTSSKTQKKVKLDVSDDESDQSVTIKRSLFVNPLASKSFEEDQPAEKKIVD